MPRLNKVFYNGGLHWITTSVEEGIMFPPNGLINEVVKKCIAQAQNLHPVEISHILFNTTHVHFIMRVIDPHDAADFMERFKSESAHIINRLLGRKKRTIWCEGYDSPIIDDIETVKQKIVYAYSNPAKDGLVDNIDEYPGINSWKQFIEQIADQDTAVNHETYALSRNDFEPLPSNRQLTESDYKLLRGRVLNNHKNKNEEMRKIYYTIDPNSWMQRFGITDPKEQDKINQEIIQAVRVKEEQFRKERKNNNQLPIGHKKLVQTAIGSLFIPIREGKRMLVHSVYEDFRIMMITWLRGLIQEGKDVLKVWRKGDMSMPYPPGLFPPTGFRQLEPIGW